MRSRIVIAAVLTAFVVAAILATTAGGAGAAVTCELVAEGPPGPQGDVLRIVDHANSVTNIDVHEGRIVIFNNLDSEPTACKGEAPTVTNVDSIEYRTAHGGPFIGYHSDGRFAPGATPEPGSGSEIEITVVETAEPPELHVAGTDGADRIEVGTVAEGTFGVNLDAGADGTSQDADVTMRAKPGSDSSVYINGRDGDDELSALGGAAFSGPPAIKRLILDGGIGDDRLAGGPGRDSLIGDLGDDVLLGGRGRDSLTVGPGRDIAKGGKGADRIENRSSVGGIPDDLGPDLVFGGSGDDQIDVISEHGGDKVDCGSGTRDQVRIEPGDHQRRCESVETESL